MVIENGEGLAQSDFHENEVNDTTMGEQKNEDDKKPRGRAAAKPFPPMTFRDALELAKAIQEHASGQKVRRLTIFDKMKKSPGSGHSRALITNSQRYGLTSGNYNSEYLELTPEGEAYTRAETKPQERLRQGFNLGIQSNEIFKGLYEKLVNNKLPSDEVMEDFAGDLGVEEADRKLCIHIFLDNVDSLDLIKTLSGVKRLISVDHAMELLPGNPVEDAQANQEHTVAREADSHKNSIVIEGALSNVCFFIAPIGEENDEERKHSDMMLEAFIERAIEDMGLIVIRADKITNPGMISSQVIEHLLKAKIVVADLSFHNPNVFYELAIRHMVGLPTVHIIRSEDHIPFDIANFRTVTIDTSDKYELVRKLEKYREEIRKQIQKAIDEPKAASNNPIIAFAPWLKDSRLLCEKNN